MSTTNTIILAVVILGVGGVIAWALTRPSAVMVPAPPPAPVLNAPAQRRSGLGDGLAGLADLVRTGQSVYTSIQGSSSTGLGKVAGGK